MCRLASYSDPQLIIFKQAPCCSVVHVWPHCAAGTSRSLWTFSWASSQRLSSCRACLATLSCWSSTSGQPTMPRLPRMLPASSSTLSTCVSSTTVTPPTNASTRDRCSFRYPPCPNLSLSHWHVRVVYRRSLSSSTEKTAFFSMLYLPDCLFSETWGQV